jgi:hypothetical protein
MIREDLKSLIREVKALKDLDSRYRSSFIKRDETAKVILLGQIRKQQAVLFTLAERIEREQGRQELFENL